MIIIKKIISKILCFVFLFTLLSSTFMLCTAQDTNLALGKSVTVSRETDKKDHTKVTDGKKDVTTSGKAWNIKAEDYIIIDLEKSVDFNQIIIYEYSFQRGMDYKVEISNDNSSWKTIKESNGIFSDLDLNYSTNAPHYAGVISLEKNNARYVKFTVNNTDGGKICYIEEIEIYNSDAPNKYPGEATVTKSEQSSDSSVNGFVTAKVATVADGNFASGKPVLVSRQTDGKNHARITDGTKNINSSASAWNVKAGDYVIIDLQENKEIDCMVVYEYSHLRAKDYTVELSQDMSNWTTVVKVTDYICLNGETSAVSNAPHYYGQLEFEKSTARYVKLTINEIEDNKVSYIEEIEVFNKTNMPEIDTAEAEEHVTLNAPKTAENIPYTKENFHIYLFIGQSNMNGRDKVPKEDMVVLNKVYLLNKEGQWEYAQPYPNSNSRYSDYQGYNRYSTVDEDTKNGMNPAMSFARALEKNTSNDIGIGIISNARGGTSIEKWQKGSGENLYEEAVNRTKEAMSKGGTLKAILWLQGESCAKKDGYLDKLNTMVTNMRNDLDVSDDVPFIASQIIQTRPEGNVVIAKISEKIANSDYISSEGTDTIDGLHYNAESQRLIGVRYAEKIMDKIYNKSISATELYDSVYNKETVPEYQYKIKVNGKYLITDVEPLMHQDRLFVPLRAIFEALGAEVSWEDTTQTVTGTKGNSVVIMQIGNQNAKVNGQDKIVDVAPMLHNSRTLIPIRFVSESLGATVEWDESSNTASISLN